MIKERIEYELAEMLNELRHEYFVSAEINPKAPIAEIFRCKVHAKMQEIMDKGTWREESQSAEELAKLIEEWVKAAFAAAADAESIEAEYA